MAAINWPYNTRRWRKLRDYVLIINPFCVYCEEIGKYTPATMVDHIIPIRERPDLAFDLDNLQPLCRQCHDSVKRREESTGKRIGCDTNGNPVGGW